MQLLFHGIFWFGLYLVLVLLPLGIAVFTDAAPASRPWLVEFSVGLGFIAFTVMAFEFALVGRLKRAADPFGMDALMQFHGQMGIVAAMFVAAHVAALVAVGSPPSMLNPLAGSLVAQSGAIAVWALVVLVVTSIWRRHLRLSYELWQWLHALAAVTVVIASLVHAMAANRHLSAASLRGVMIAYVIVFLALMMRYRILRPLQLWRRSWQVVANRDEGGDTRTLCLTPIAHDGLPFEPGQFVWLNTASHPFAIEQHPISIASSAENPRELELSIKALGNWSRNEVPAIQPGSRVWLDGCYGAFTPDRLPGQGFVLIGGGVGITPMRSILLTMRDRGDVRPVTLIYAANSPQRMIYVPELRDLEKDLNVQCVFVYEAPPPTWTGERGLVDTELLRRYLPKQALHYQYFVCGPDPMTVSVETSLLALGVPADRISTERFDIG